MRTTLTLDDDVAALLERVRAERRAGLKDVVNEALRVGLRGLAEPPRRRALYRTSVVSLGKCLVGSLDDVSEALVLAEGRGTGTAIESGADLVAYWRREALIGARPDIEDASAHARALRADAERRRKPGA